MTEVAHRKPLAEALLLPLPAVTTASETMANGGIKERGAIFTRHEVVDFILDLCGYTTDRPLYQYRYPKNWGFIVNVMRTYALKNFYIHDHHEKGIEAMETIIDVLLEAIHSPDMLIQQSAIDSLMFYLEKILIDGNQDLSRYASIFQDCFAILDQLQEKQFFLLITNPHQLKKLGQVILKNMPPF